MARSRSRGPCRSRSKPEGGMSGRYGSDVVRCESRRLDTTRGTAGGRSRQCTAPCRGSGRDSFAGRRSVIRPDHHGVLHGRGRGHGPVELHLESNGVLIGTGNSLRLVIWISLQVTWTRPPQRSETISRLRGVHSLDGGHSIRRASTVATTTAPPRQPHQGVPVASRRHHAPRQSAEPMPSRCPSRSAWW